MVSRLQGPSSKIAQNRAWTKDAETAGPYIPWLNSPLKNNATVEPAIELGPLVEDNDFTTELCGRTNKANQLTK